MKSGRFLVTLLAVLALLAVPIAVYVAGYVFLCEKQECHCRDSVTGELTLTDVFRCYRWEWQSTVFEPAGRLEEHLRDIPIEVYHQSFDIDGQRISWVFKGRFPRKLWE